MYQSFVESLHGGRVSRHTMSASGSQLSYGDVLELWQSNEEFRVSFLSLLAESSYSAFRWETPPITSGTLDRLFEFVLVDSPGLDRPPQRKAFEEYYDLPSRQDDIVCFDNLRGDAGLVVPCPGANDADYVHLATFVRKAPDSQRHALWQSVGLAVEQRLSERPLWLSTAGGGVAWLHVRLDSRPKYYNYSPYKDAVE